VRSVVRGSLPLAASLLQALTMAVNNCTTVHPNVTHTGKIAKKIVPVSKCRKVPIMVTVLTCIWEVPGSILSWHNDYPEALRGFLR
jgi:hypothetical protein